MNDNVARVAVAVHTYEYKLYVGKFDEVGLTRLTRAVGVAKKTKILL